MGRRIAVRTFALILFGTPAQTINGAELKSH
jgi:hypothetical protein